MQNEVLEQIKRELAAMSHDPWNEWDDGYIAALRRVTYLAEHYAKAK